MQNQELVQIFSRYSRAHKAMLECMREVERIALNEPQRTVFHQLQIDESFHEMFIDSFIKPGSLPFYFVTGNPASMGHIGASLPGDWEEDNEEDND